jgi:hypothetical protein
MERSTLRRSWVRIAFIWPTEVLQKLIVVVIVVVVATDQRLFIDEGW